MNKTIALFGESEKGRFHYPYLCSSLSSLVDHLGNSSENSSAIPFAVQSIMYEKNIIFFRVEEEGYSLVDYMAGFEILYENDKYKNLSAICLPKVSSNEIIDSVVPICNKLRSILITTQKDLFDYLVSR